MQVGIFIFIVLSVTSTTPRIGTDLKTTSFGFVGFWNVHGGTLVTLPFLSYSGNPSGSKCKPDDGLLLTATDNLLVWEAAADRILRLRSR